jgi:hypothetical protein|tara:strand:- start:5623 stop:6432 length:810 start_codon:yes stop_codon:yes gene_type:complete
MISGIHTTKLRTQRYVDAFVKGSGAGKIYQFRKMESLPGEELTMYGILAGSGEIYKKCEKENKNFYFMDHGYFTNAHDSPHWLRITKNKHCQNMLQQRPTDRYEKNFKQDIKPWKKGRKILVLPPTNAIANFFNATDWLDKTVKILKENTDREIDVREKPYNPTVAIDHVGATVKVDKPTKQKGNIDWNDYYAMVTYNSNTMVASLANGVPVFCDAVNSAAAPISETDFSKIETPIYGDRIALFSSLAYNNWNLNELANGTAWRMLNES